MKLVKNSEQATGSKERPAPQDKPVLKSSGMGGEGDSKPK